MEPDILDIDSSITKETGLESILDLEMGLESILDLEREEE